jgi:hypothetical protein
VTVNVNPVFAKWATGFSGCNGGNLHGSVWFCGIEWGTGKEHMIIEEVKEDVSNPPQRYESSEAILMNVETGRHMIKSCTRTDERSLHRSYSCIFKFNVITSK